LRRLVIEVPVMRGKQLSGASRNQNGGKKEDEVV